MLAVVVAASIVTAGVGSVLMGGSFIGGGMIAATGSSVMWGAMAGAAFVVAGGLLVNALLPVSSSVDSVDASYATSDYGKSNTYSWDPSPNGYQEGGMLGVLYGTHRVTPTSSGGMSRPAATPNISISCTRCAKGDGWESIR
jgi:predicted phage tail protein